MIKRQANLLTRREWDEPQPIGHFLPGPNPLQRQRVGQPILAPGPWFTDVAEKAGLTAFRTPAAGRRRITCWKP